MLLSGKTETFPPCAQIKVKQSWRKNIRRVREISSIFPRPNLDPIHSNESAVNWIKKVLYGSSAIFHLIACRKLFPFPLFYRVCEFYDVTRACYSRNCREKKEETEGGWRTNLTTWISGKMIARRKNFSHTTRIPFDCLTWKWSVMDGGGISGEADVNGCEASFVCDVNNFFDRETVAGFYRDPLTFVG